MLKTEIINQDCEISETSSIIQELQDFDKRNNPKESLQGPECDRSQPLLSDGSVYWISVALSPQCEMKLARAYLIEAKLQDLGEILSTEPKLEDQQEIETLGRIRWLLSTFSQPPELEHAVSLFMEVEFVSVEAADLPVQRQIRTEEFELEHGVDEADSSYSTERTKPQTVRVNVERLEHLMNLVGELVIDQTRIQQVDKQMNQKFGSDETVEELGQISDHLTRIIGELQESVMKARMLPIEQLFNRFPRMVRDLTQMLYKEVELVIDGKDTELDRTLIDEIGDPLIHLIRNAIDHGIEAPNVRRASGKPEKGLLRITAAHEDNQVVISVEDDGAGIDPEKIKKSAVQKAIITEQEASQLSTQDAIHLIFHPGFSTANSVSEVSGRGVGMDIVRTDIERLNGLIDIQTELGKGTRFKIRLPLTLAIITGLMVKLSGRTFIIPMGNVAEIVRFELSVIQTVRGNPVIFIRNQVIPVVWLQDAFGYDKVQGKKHLSLVIVGRAEKRIALVVDELLGNQEIVIKSLGSFIGKVDGISGATILGDGRVALILEVAGIMKMLGRTG